MAGLELGSLASPIERFELPATESSATSETSTLTSQSASVHNTLQDAQLDAAGNIDTQDASHIAETIGRDNHVQLRSPAITC